MDADDKTHSVGVPSVEPVDKHVIPAKSFDVPPGTSALANNHYTIEAAVPGPKKFFDVNPMIEADRSLNEPGGGGKDSLSEEEALLG